MIEGSSTVGTAPRNEQEIQTPCRLHRLFEIYRESTGGLERIRRSLDCCGRSVTVGKAATFTAWHSCSGDALQPVDENRIEELRKFRRNQAEALLQSITSMVQTRLMPAHPAQLQDVKYKYNPTLVEDNPTCSWSASGGMNLRPGVFPAAHFSASPPPNLDSKCPETSMPRSRFEVSQAWVKLAPSATRCRHGR
jgi:hypothetical protein